MSFNVAGWIDFTRMEAVQKGDLQHLQRSTTAPDVVSVSGHWLHLQVRAGTSDIFVDDAFLVVSAGAPRFVDSALSKVAEHQGSASAWALLFKKLGHNAAQEVAGAYSVVVIDALSRKVALTTDRFGLSPLCYAFRNKRISFSDQANSVPSHGSERIDPQAIFDYLHFHVIPAPRTIFEGVRRLSAGHSLTVTQEGCVVSRYWNPVFEEPESWDFEELKAKFRFLLRTSVRSELSHSKTGCFLSGGTDSSTIAGTMAEIVGEPPKTYSIGFDAAGYDEMEYARTAARHFNTEHHEYYITPDDLVHGIPHVAVHYDQPFGNSSALPTYYCAKVAKEDGIEKLLAGDGGDELFGGNSRYAKQKMFAYYKQTPALLRERFVEPLLLGSSAASHIPLLKKAVSYIKQAKTPMPDRMNAYNLLARLGIGTVLTEDVLKRVNIDAPAQLERLVYENCEADALVNKMLAYDWKFTLADNDLPKVCGTTKLAGVDVGFPMLADELVDFSLQLPVSLKVKGLKLRYFFKEALKDFLPKQIITKKKHGFGLPFGPWVLKHKPLKALAFDALTSFRNRGIVRNEFLDKLMNHALAQHPGYYGEMVWSLMMLELWLDARAKPASIHVLSA